MTSGILRLLHAPVWIVFVVIFGVYILTVGWWMINGYSRELFGSPLMHMGRIHKLVYGWHTGLHMHPNRTYGDEGWRRKVSGGGSGTSHYTPWKRWHRALRNNLITIAWLLASCGMAIDPPNTIRAIVWLVFIMAIAAMTYGVRNRRKNYRRSRPVSRPAIARTKVAKQVLLNDTATVGARPKLEIEARPQLKGVPQSVLAGLLSARMGCSTAEILNRLKMVPERAELMLPDTFAAMAREREPVQEIIEAHTAGKIKFEWKTTSIPRALAWVPVVERTLPTLVRFRDHLDKIEALAAREFGVGLRDDLSMYVTSHNGDKPWHCRFAGSGSGKSIGFLVKAAQICHKDPSAEIYGIDTKQVSFGYLRDIPGVHIFDDPQGNMPAIWQVFYTLNGIMRDRYTALRQKRIRPADLHDIWVFVDEGNDLAACLKSYHKNVLKETSASPAIWGECVGTLLRQGRQASMFGEWMFQDLLDKAMGGESLKPAFGVFGAAGFLPGQFTRTLGPPAPELLEGPGKILMCSGNKRTWVQGFYDDENFLHEYALENRKAV